MKPLLLHPASMLLVLSLCSCSGERLRETQASLSQPRSPQENSEIITRIRAYLNDNFGQPGFETMWYSNIRIIDVAGEIVTARTDLRTNGQTGHGVCAAVSGFVFSKTDGESLGLRRVRVLSARGDVLIDRPSVAARCE